AAERIARLERAADWRGSRRHGWLHCDRCFRLGTPTVRSGQIGLREVATGETEPLAGKSCGRVRHAVADVQRGRVSPLAVASERVHRLAPVDLPERDLLNRELVQHP